MAITKNDLQSTYVGQYIELFEIDATDIGGSIWFIAPSVGYDEVTGITSQLNFNSQTYWPTPCKFAGITASTQGAPATPTFAISNVHKYLHQAVFELEGLQGAKFKRRRTFSEFLIAGDELPSDTYIISQVTKFNRNEIVFKLNQVIDQEGSKLPFRQVLKDGPNGFPGASRAGSRNR